MASAAAPDSAAPPPPLPAWAWGAPAAVAALLYVWVLALGFPYDDELIIRDQRWLRRAASFGELASPEYFRSNEISWRPAATLTHLVEMQLAGAPAVYPPGWRAKNRVEPVAWAHPTDPPAWLFHATNWALHIAVAALCALVAAQVVRWGRAPPAGAAVPAWAALIAGGCVAVHPVCVESVAVISFREDLLAAVGMLGALWCLGPRDTAPGWGRCAAGWALAGLAIFAKESALLLPLWLLAAEWLGTRAGARRGGAIWARVHGPVVALALVYAVLRFGSLAGPLESTYAAMAPSFGYRVLMVPQLFLLHVRLLLLPLWLSADYLVIPPLVPWDWRVIAGCGAAAAAVWGGWRAWRAGRPAIVIGAALIVCTLGPVSGLMPLPNPMAERYLYVAVSGLALVLAGLAAPWLADPAQRRRVLTVAAAVAAVCAVRTVTRIPVWQNTERVWASAPRRSLRVASHESAAAKERGDFEGMLRIAARARRWFDGVPPAAAPWQFHPVFWTGQAWRLQADAAMRAGQPFDTELAEAERWCREALALNPLHPVVHEELGHIARQRQAWDAAVTHYTRSAELNPRLNSRAWFNAAEVHLAAGRPADAQAALRRALAAAPHSVAASNKLAQLLIDGAGGDAATAVQTPAGAEAIGLWENAARNNPWDWESRFNRGISMLVLKRDAEAATSLRQALALAPSNAAVARAAAEAFSRIRDPAGMVQALRAWAAAAPEDPEPRNRLQQMGIR